MSNSKFGLRTRKGIIRPFIEGSPASLFTFLLDTYNNSYGAYSLRKLRSTYTGNCIRVRRSSDNTEQDIGFVNNVLDTASLQTFVGANTGFVTKWYNQTTFFDPNYNLDISQSVAVNQPIIINAGSLYTVNGKASIYFTDDSLNGTNNIMYKLFHDGSNSTTFIVNQTQIPALTSAGYFSTVNTNGGSAIGAVFTYANSGGGVSNRLGNYAYNNSGVTVPVINEQNNAITTGSQKLISLFMRANNTPVADRSEIQVNNGTLYKNNTNTAAISTGNCGANFSMGSMNNTYFFTGHFQEFVVFQDDKRTTRTNINNSINSYYGTY